ncbi:hypothetical protein SD71_02690 [Cohnella kolymensis]|uniref:Helix-turn-helix conjugative transposon-like domain-containing protein n=1 Tax=Cohnella kolymensis TaxID=1590652 RepID=A0ABR5A928_9BACL|nr:hypothetical protein SD71_02690 [Cohnella kolymensis]
MEEKSTPIPLTDSEFITLLHSARQGDQEALLKLIRFFQEDVSRLIRFIRLPKEDAEQSMITEMIELFKKREL